MNKPEIANEKPASQDDVEHDVAPIIPGRNPRAVEIREIEVPLDVRMSRLKRLRHSIAPSREPESR